MHRRRCNADREDTDSDSGHGAGGLCFRGSSPFAGAVASSIFTSNSVNGSSYAYGGGVWAQKIRAIAISNSTFTSNKVAVTRSDGFVSGGAAVMTESTRTTITSSTFTKQLALSAAANASNVLGAISAKWPGTVTLSRVVVTDNSGAYSGVSDASLC